MDNYALSSAHNQIQNIIRNGGEVLYDKYINQKLPQKITEQQNKIIDINMQIISIKQPQRHIFSNLSNYVVQNCTKDQLVPLSIPVNHQRSIKQQFSSQINQIFDKKIDKVAHFNSEIVTNYSNTKDKVLIISQQNVQNVINPERPFQQISDKKQAQNPYNKIANFDINVSQRRASTSMNNRTKYPNKRQMIRQHLINLTKDQDIKSIQKQYVQLTNYKVQNSARSLQIQTKQKRFQQLVQYVITQRKKQQIQVKQKYYKLKSKLHQQISNFQSIDGQIMINDHIKQKLHHHILQLNIKKCPESPYSTLKPQQMLVNKFRNRFFRGQGCNYASYKGQKKKKINNTDYNNNGIRQISSIPYVNLSQGILMSQSSGITVSAIRRRSKDQITMSQYNTMQPSAFKSFNHNFHLTKKPQNINTIYNDQAHKTNQINTQQKTSKSIENSILWNPRKLSQNKYIKVSNKRYFNEQILNI